MGRAFYAAETNAMEMLDKNPTMFSVSFGKYSSVHLQNISLFRLILRRVTLLTASAANHEEAAVIFPTVVYTYSNVQTDAAEK